MVAAVTTDGVVVVLIWWVAIVTLAGIAYALRDFLR
jgi:hypothetical protein